MVRGAAEEKQHLDDRLGNPEGGVPSHIEDESLLLLFAFLAESDRVGHVFTEVIDGEESGS